MEIEILTKEDLQTLRFQLIDDIKKMLEPQKGVHKEWMKSCDVRKLLNISSGTLQNLRITGELNPVRIGGSYYYKTEEVNKLFER